MPTLTRFAGTSMFSGQKEVATIKFTSSMTQDERKAAYQQTVSAVKNKETILLSAGRGVGAITLTCAALHEAGVTSYALNCAFLTHDFLDDELDSTLAEVATESLGQFVLILDDLDRLPDGMLYNLSEKVNASPHISSVLLRVNG